MKKQQSQTEERAIMAMEVEGVKMVGFEPEGIEVRKTHQWITRVLISHEVEYGYQTVRSESRISKSLPIDKSKKNDLA